MEDPSTPTTPSVKEQVQQLRQKQMPIRKIAQELGVTKYAVETALKELESERLQTLPQTKEEEPRTTGNTAGRTDQTGAGVHPDNGRTTQNESQTLQNHHQTGPQTHPDTVKNAPQEGVLGQQTQQKTAKIRSSYAFSSFQTDYNRFFERFSARHTTGKEPLDTQHFRFTAARAEGPAEKGPVSGAAAGSGV
ncbi:hypothetical protein ACFS7Z_25045 [Pontibacter toksunensis]|uniref:Uncharacterized protein n=1 Tax=Pontibacter toksunensis TaxID=1332631 RepID=A0ABW6C7C8_9BACT